MKKLLQEFIKSGKEEYSFSRMIPLSTIEDILKDIGFKDCDEAETNGCDVDFWYYYEHQEYGRYYITGSLWRGKFKIMKQ